MSKSKNEPKLFQYKQLGASAQDIPVLLSKSDEQLGASAQGVNVQLSKSKDEPQNLQYKQLRASAQDANVQLVRGQIEFAIELYEQVKQVYDNSANLTLLPLSVSSNILHINVGAKSDTREEIQNLLHLPSVADGDDEGGEAIQLAKMVRKLESFLPRTMICRDMILLDRLYVVTGEFAKMSADCFPATKVKLFDFMSVPKRVRLNMKKTAHRRYDFRCKRSLMKLSEAKLIAAARLLVKRNPIKNLKTMNKVLENSIEPPFLVETPILDPFSSLAIINAATFKLKFDTIFEKSRTKKENFALLSSQ